FTRTYNNGVAVTLTAPASAGVNTFQKWQRDGVDFSVSRTTTVTLDANRTLSAVFAAPAPPPPPPPPPSTAVLTVASINPASAVPVAVSPVDNAGLSSGNTLFTRTFNAGITATLATPTAVGANVFQKWQRDGIDLTTSPTATV